jgi:hypothetical protein
MLGGNNEATNTAKEYYPAYKKEDGTEVPAINTLGLDLDGGGTPSTESQTYTISFNGQNVESQEGFFSFGEKHNFNTKFTGTYDGMTFNSGLKMESTTQVAFTTNAVGTITIVQSTWSDYTIKLDGTELAISSATTPTSSTGVRVYKEAIAAGNHKITRGSGESGLFYVEVKTMGTSSISEVNTDTPIGTEYYSLQGMRISKPTSGAYIRLDRMADGSSRSWKVAIK